MQDCIQITGPSNKVREATKTAKLLELNNNNAAQTVFEEKIKLGDASDRYG